MRHICRQCKHYQTSIMRGPYGAICLAVGNKVDLITGEKLSETSCIERRYPDLPDHFQLTSETQGNDTCPDYEPLPAPTPPPVAL